jgi:chorismate mutase/prephenate dehydratase
MGGRKRVEGSTTKPSGDPLADLRDRINRLDERLVELLNQRARLVVKVGRIKREEGIPIYTPHRETQVLNKVLGLNQGPLPDRTIEGIYRELMSGSFRLEQPPRIGYLGPVGSFSHVAAVKHFGTSVDFEDLHAIEGVFTEVARGHVDYGLVPIENSIGGGIAETLEAFQAFTGQVNIYAEVQLEVHHALLANCAPGAVKRIYSKPEVFTQCRKWLATQYPDAELVPEASSSAAVKRAAEESEAKTGRQKNRNAGKKSGASGSRGVGAIGSVLAGEIYDLSVLFENIEDHANNITRFFVISKEKAQPTGKDSEGRPGDKTSIMFTTPDKPGALVAVLSVFDRAGINLTHIDKRPSGRSNWEYTFFIDAEGHIDDPWFAGAVAQAKGHCRELTVLGSYPRSKRIL